MRFRRWLITLGKLVLCSMALMVGIEIGGLAAALVGLQHAPVPPRADRNLLHLYTLLGTPLLSLALAPVARGLGARFMAHSLSLSFLTWMVHAVNDQLEGLLISTASTGLGFAFVESLVASLCGGMTVALLFPPAVEGAEWRVLLRAFFARRGLWAWLWRCVVASVVFMPIYFVFGLLVLPFVSEYYHQGVYGLKEPAVDQLLIILFIRSMLFFLACLPILITWRGSARSLFLRLGVALFVLVSVPSIFITYWLPVGLRLPHTLEILTDEFVYVGVLIAFLEADGTTTIWSRSG